MSIIEQIKVSFRYLTTNRYFADDKESRNIYRVTITYANNRTSFKFGDSLNNTQMGKMLDSKADKNMILECVCSDYYYTEEYYPNYEEFSKEFGYNEDSIKGLKIYKNCLKQAAKLRRVFNEEAIEQIRKELEA